MIVKIYVYAWKVCNCCISIYGESYAHAFIVRGDRDGPRGATDSDWVHLDPAGFLLSPIRGDRDGPRGVIDSDWIHSNPTW